ncbi:hypothetical protein BJ508DRAFT_376381 [Ascobolus immersus RN42]|uniref:RING-type domain-containing protein n=1 Tax=Ascobolus immersus RN42 TaxID=1160509 RepID=A0A3N4I5V8_ASCIM|nr:hypothetical protein BJ508DRAFT_376381 [Ascobolus immersus RN42]
MASYEDDHNITTNTIQSAPRQRPDLTEFLSTLNLATTSTPHFPADAPAAPFSSLATAYRNLDVETPLLHELVAILLAEASDPTKREEGGGVPLGWEDGLDRVDVKKLSADDQCPICLSVFKDDPWPLVVRLPCDPKHMFDLECVQGWLRLHSTCPLDRKDLLKNEKKVVPPPAEDSEEEWDDNYG